MQSKEELQKVKDFYYSKRAQGLSWKECNKLVELYSDGSWVSMTFSDELKWGAKEYRIKPETVTRPGGTYRKPCDDSRAILEAKRVYCPSWYWDNGNFVASYRAFAIREYEDAVAYAKSGMFHLTEKAALEHAEVLYGKGK